VKAIVAAPSRERFGHAAALPSVAGQRDVARWWLLFFIAFQIVCQLLLLRPEIQPIRGFVRAGSFGVALLLLLAIHGKPQADRISRFLIVALVFIGIGLFHPQTPSILAAVGVVALYLAVFSPVFWVSRLRINLDTLRIIMIALWAFHALSSTVGVLQTYFPGQFMGAVSSILEAKPAYLDGLMIQLDDGTRVFRPMGLTDQPGGASISGMYVCLFGMALLLDRRYRWWRILFALGMTAGLYCLLLSQVRVFMVALAICFVAFMAVLAIRGQSPRLFVIIGWLAAVIVVSATWAMSIGRQAVLARLITLVEQDPLAVYAGNRGIFLEYTLKYVIWEHPLGAGLGRWGMANVYVGDPSQALWSEINWTAWCYDGGVPLMLVMACVMIYVTFRAYKVTADRSSSDWCIWGAMVVGYNLAFFATTFCGNPLLSQMGIEYFMLNTVFYTAWMQRERVPRNCIAARVVHARAGRGVRA